MSQRPALDFAHFLPYRLSVASNTISQAIAADYEARFGLSVTQWRVMAILGRHDDLAAREVAVAALGTVYSLSQSGDELSGALAQLLNGHA